MKWFPWLIYGVIIMQETGINIASRCGWNWKDFSRECVSVENKYFLTGLFLEINHFLSSYVIEIIQ